MPASVGLGVQPLCLPAPAEPTPGRGVLGAEKGPESSTLARRLPSSPSGRGVTGEQGCGRLKRREDQGLGPWDQAGSAENPRGSYGSREFLLAAGAVCAGPLVQASQRGALWDGASRDVGSRLLGQVCRLRVPELAQPPRAGPQLKLCCVTESGASFRACPRPGPWVFFVAHRFGGSVCHGAPCGHLRGL